MITRSFLPFLSEPIARPTSYTRNAFMAKPQSSTRKQKKPRKPGRPRLHLSPAKANVNNGVNNLLSAIQSVRDGTPMYQAARMHGVPRSTLHDRISGRVKHGTNPGPKPYLNKAEETELSDFLVNVAKAEYGKSNYSHS